MQTTTEQANALNAFLDGKGVPRYDGMNGKKLTLKQRTEAALKAAPVSPLVAAITNTLNSQTVIDGQGNLLVDLLDSPL